MATIEFTPNLAKHIEVDSLAIDGNNLREVLDQVCADNLQLKSYLLDDQDRLRKHVTIFVDNVQLKDRNNLSDAVAPNSSVYIAQALSGG
ncbi:MAG: MoaD/ThiS family protein [Pseudomonadales bacterium]|nr:MoaD/ThiS family protein [Pseudomonadales bacterium]